MVSNSALSFVKLILSYYWNKKFRKNLKTDIEIARCFGNIFLFIDDVTAVSDITEFKRSCRETFSFEFELKKESFGYLQQSFLDIAIP